MRVSLARGPRGPSPTNTHCTETHAPPTFVGLAHAFPPTTLRPGRSEAREGKTISVFGGTNTTSRRSVSLGDGGRVEIESPSLRSHWALPVTPPPRPSPNSQTVRPTRTTAVPTFQRAGSDQSPFPPRQRSKQRKTSEWQHRVGSSRYPPTNRMRLNCPNLATRR